MSALSQQPPQFFHRGPSPAARLAFFGLLSLAALFVDSHYRYLESVRQGLATALYPLQRLAGLPLELSGQVGEYFRSVSELENETDALRRQLLMQAPAVQAYASLEQENTALRQLAKIAQAQPGREVLAEIIYGPRDPFTQKVVVDKGAQAHVDPGQAVIDENGVLGQVTRVYEWMSEVTLVTDKEQSTPVKVRRNSVHGVLYGAGGGRPLELRFMSASADVQPGDVLVTSGIDGTYPPDLAVATVTAVERETGALFARIQCEPAAAVDRSRQMLIVALPTAVAARPAPAVETATGRKPGKPKRHDQEPER